MDVVDRLMIAYRAAADPERAVAMSAYMRDLFPFLGIPTPRRRALDRAVLAGLPARTASDVPLVAELCWELPEREYQYFGADWLRRAAPRSPATLLPVVRGLITTKSWWDTVDTLATRVVGPLGAAHPAVRDEMDEWITDPDVWVIRTALLHQLHYGADTVTERLFAYSLRQAGHPDFFVRKAIGWALRHYARTAPEEVRAFVTAHADVLSPLSVREALKNL
ncbi:3-methyladenine DNA glycosylase AlkD [Catenuloplanes nepalensis]|uniref:3-methyladenine DNA glycosylase AlkD n=1 Tax=Catenuloplanes nepalensis TaxID=587533 RepID=A0ABT9ML55_9ACTN|nr:DNA alkylation repair protein [Catenuloplanes nepalensis]MDP9792148.1 3-methyladenine DNA glycosylase AlkD [Catenuloplanes nepalensis]